MGLSLCPARLWDTSASEPALWLPTRLNPLPPCPLVPACRSCRPASGCTPRLSRCRTAAPDMAAAACIRMMASRPACLSAAWRPLLAVARHAQSLHASAMARARQVGGTRPQASKPRPCTVRPCANGGEAEPAGSPGGSAGSVPPQSDDIDKKVRTGPRWDSGGQVSWYPASDQARHERPTCRPGPCPGL